MGDHVAFFYGTLLVPGILYRVIYGSRNPEPWQQALTKLRPGLLEGYQRRKVKHVHYPAIVSCAGASVRGTICTGLTDGDMWRLDVFEGDEYYKVKTKAKVLKDEVGIAGIIPDDKMSEYVVDEIEVSVYVWKEDWIGRLEDEEWDFEEFRRNKMKLWTGEDSPENGNEVDEGFEDVQRATDVQRAAEEMEKVVGKRGVEAVNQT